MKHSIRFLMGALLSLAVFGGTAFAQATPTLWIDEDPALAALEAPNADDIQQGPDAADILIDKADKRIDNLHDMWRRFGAARRGLQDDRKELKEDLQQNASASEIGRDKRHIRKDREKLGDARRELFRGRFHRMLGHMRSMGRRFWGHRGLATPTVETATASVDSPASTPVEPTGTDVASCPAGTDTGVVAPDGTTTAATGTATVDAMAAEAKSIIAKVRQRVATYREELKKIRAEMKDEWKGFREKQKALSGQIASGTDKEQIRQERRKIRKDMREAMRQRREEMRKLFADLKADLRESFKRMREIRSAAGQAPVEPKAADAPVPPTGTSTQILTEPAGSIPTAGPADGTGVTATEPGVINKNISSAED